MFEGQDLQNQKLKQLKLFDNVHNSMSLKFTETIHKYLMRHPIELYPIIQYIVFHGRKKLNDEIVKLSDYGQDNGATGQRLEIQANQMQIESPLLFHHDFAGQNHPNESNPAQR